MTSDFVATKKGGSSTVVTEISSDEGWVVLEKNIPADRYSIYSDTPILITTSSDLSMNKMAWEMIGRPARVKTIYNKKTAQFGFMATDARDKKGYLASLSGHLLRISAVAFMTKYGLRPPKGISRVYKCEFHERLNAVITTGENPTTLG